MKYLVSLFCVLLVICSAPIGSLAADKVVVIPIMSHQSKPLKNVVTVAKKNGDFTDPVAAMNSITDAAADNPYLIVIAPGVYTLTETLVMKRYVSITGSGEDVTILTGAISHDNSYSLGALVSVTMASRLAKLAVDNKGGGDYSAAITVHRGHVDRIVAKVSGSTHNLGIYTADGITEKVRASAYGGTEAYGIIITGRYGKTTDIDVYVSGATNLNCGIYLPSAYRKEKIANAHVWINSKNTCFGIWVDNIQDDTIFENMDISVSSTTSTAYGIERSSFSNPPVLTLRRSTVSGTTKALYVNNHTSFPGYLVRANQSTVIGGMSIQGHGIMQCVACDDGNGGELGSDCQ